MIKNTHWVLCASFEENCAQTRAFSNTPFNMREIIFLSMGQNKYLPQFSCIFHLLKYAVILPYYIIV